MSTWSDAAPYPGTSRSTVLRGGAASFARPARMDAELRTSPFAASYAVDSRLTDPHLEQVVRTATEAAVERGRAEGEAAGYAAGQAIAAAEAELAAQAQAQAFATAERRREARLQESLAVLAGLAEELRSREAVALAEVEGVVVDLALQIARTVLDRELATTADPGREALVRALALAPQDTAATARLNPADVATLAGVDELAAGRALTVVADASVERGGCVLDTAGRSIDTQVGTALSRVAAVLA
jgi:flagellar assembly protein FliH